MVAANSVPDAQLEVGYQSQLPTIDTTASTAQAHSYRQYELQRDPHLSSYRKKPPVRVPLSISSPQQTAPTANDFPGMSPLERTPCRTEAPCSTGHDHQAHQTNLLVDESKAHGPHTAPPALPPSWFKALDDYWSQIFLFWTFTFLTLDFLIIILPSWILLAVFGVRKPDAGQEYDLNERGRVYFGLIGSINLVFIPLPVYLYLLSRAHLWLKLKKVQLEETKSLSKKDHIHAAGQADGGHMA